MWIWCMESIMNYTINIVDDMVQHQYNNIIIAWFNLKCEGIKKDEMWQG